MLTEKHKATNYETMRHIERVRNLLNRCISKLLRRGEEHDQSKLESPEVEIFSEHTDNLKHMTFGSKEYFECLEKMKPALEHHYARNSHHPEHKKNGIKDMSLLDVLEMLCDWKAASERHSNGDIIESIDINAKRFNISEDLVSILKNTVKEIE